MEQPKSDLSCKLPGGMGASVPRVDAEAKVTGRARYTDDLGLPGMLHAVFVRSPIAHGLVKAVDATNALAVPGVTAVFTPADVPEPLFPTAGHPFSIYPDHGDVADRRILTDHVRQHGDEVALVVARDALTARRAARLVNVTYEELPVLTTAEAALEPGAPVLHPDVRPESNLLGCHTLNAGGDLEAGMAEADLVLEGSYATPTVQHCHLENQTAYAYMDDMQHIVVVSSTQIPFICRRVIGQALGLPWGRIRVIKPYIGGGFGNKQDVCIEPAVAFLTLKLDGAPVSIELTREESMLATRVRHAFAMKTKVGVTRAGRLTGYSLDVLSNTGAYASHGHAIASAGGAKICYIYPRAPYRFHARTVYTNIPNGGAFRGYGSPQTGFAVECAMEDAARALGMDPLAFRLQNAGQLGDPSPFNGKPLRSLGVTLCLEKGRDMFAWSERRAACEAFNIQAQATGSPLRRGVGVAALSYGSGTYPVNPEPGGARLILNPDGTVRLTAGATEIGQGADTAFAQMVAETTGIAFENIHVTSSQDTDVTPFDVGAFASRQTYTNSPAVQQAAQELKRKILEHAALMTGQVSAALDIRGDAVVFARDPSIRELTLEDVSMDALYNRDRGGQIFAEASTKTRQAPPAFGCSFTEVEVDMALCKVRIDQLLNVHDAGRIVNPQLATGQVQGGMAMGVGWALYEELLIDAKSGRVHNNNLLDYKFPTTLDMPPLQCAFVETNELSGPYGVKALGEPPLISPAPALRNAVLHATGVPVNEIPMTPKTLFRYFQAAGILHELNPSSGR